MTELSLKILIFLMAERMGFEPMIEFPPYTLSKRAPSTTRPPLHLFYKYIFDNYLIILFSFLKFKLELTGSIFIVSFFMLININFIRIYHYITYINGEMAEWLKAHAWKACKGAILSWVRIPFSPPSKNLEVSMVIYTFYYIFMKINQHFF